MVFIVIISFYLNFTLMHRGNVLLSFAGMPFNQLGTLAGSKFYNVEATYYYLRW